MKQECEKGTYIKSVRELARFFSAEQIERCLDEQVRIQTNGCALCADDTRSVDMLARAGYVKTLMTKGMTMNEAMRELGQRMRNFINNT